MKNQKGFANMSIVLAIAILVIVGVVGYVMMKKPVSTQTPTEATVNWKTYTSALGYSVNYPATWTVVPLGVGTEKIQPVQPEYLDDGVPMDYFRAEIMGNSFKHERENLNRNVGGRDSTESAITFGGENGYAYLGRFPGVNRQGQVTNIGYEVLVQHNNKVYYFWTTKYNLAEVKQIFDSFKFTDSSSTTTTNWKTYTNTQYGFEFQYISSYQFRESSNKDYGKGEPPLLKIDLAKEGFTGNNTQAFGISVNNLKYGNINDLISIFKKQYTNVSVSKKNINGDNFTMVSFVVGDWRIEAAYIERNGLLYIFTPSEETKSFLNTFKFTK